MKKTFITLIFLMIISALSYGQLTGSYTIPGTPYATVSAAISALNAQGAGTGGVIFNVAGGYTETFSSLTAGLITATGTAANPIVFQRSGAGSNPVITGCITGPGTTDYIIGLQGVDYITFDGIDVSETTGVIEWGYAILKNSTTDGSQYVTVKNCSITLNKVNTNTVAIYSANVTPAAPLTQLTITDAAGGNSNNKFYSNTISGCYNGIIINGFNDPVAPYFYYDQSNEIGKDGGNTISSIGGSSLAAYGILTSSQNRLTIANNLINGTVSNTTGTCAGIQLNPAKNATVTVHDNTVSLAYNGSSVFYGFYNSMGTTCTDNTYNFYNNIVTNCSSPNTSSGCYYIFNTHSAVNSNLYNNQVTNNTYGSATTTGSGTIYGFYSEGSSSTPSTNYIYGNSITGNVRKQSGISSGTTNYMYIKGGNNAVMTSIHDNIIANDTNNANAGSIVNCIWFNNTSLIKKLYNNTVNNIQQSNGQITGIYLAEGSNQSVYNNKIQNLKTKGINSSATIYGMDLEGSSSGGPMYVYNNFVGELRAPGSTSSTALYGIFGYGTGLTVLGIYNNTVYLDGTSTGTGFGTVGLLITADPHSADIRNNIIVNNCTPTGTGMAIALKSFGYSLYQQGITNFASTVNNNNYYAGTPSSTHLIAYITDGTNFRSDMTLDAYRLRGWPRESNSITENTPFVNVTASPYDLHLSNTTPTQCESAGQVISSPISIITDYDNDARFPNAGYPDNPSFPAVAPDMGADEMAGIPNDLTAPAIIYTPLLNSTSTDERVLTASITDAHGVPGSGNGMPRLCWKKFAAGTWNYVTGVSIGNDQYTFTFGGGANTGDSIYYYVVAQDQYTTPNVGTFPILGSGGFSTNPPAASTAPTSPNAYKIIQGRCGTLTVGVGKDFPTLTAAINDISGEGLTCPVVLLLTDNLYASETYPIIINPIPGASATNTLTIRPAAGVTPVFETSYAYTAPYYWSMITLNGAQYVIFDGSNSGGTDRSLTFRNNAINGGSATIGLYYNGVAGAGNITIKNCIVQAYSTASLNTQAIVCWEITGLGGYHDLVIQNNEINSAKYGIQVGGVSGHVSNNVVIINNTIGSLDPFKGIGATGIQLWYSNNTVVQGNEIMGTTQGLSMNATPVGITMLTGCTNTKVKHNLIHDIINPGTTGGANGILYQSDATTVSEISDNVIYNIKAAGSNTSITGANPFGIFIYSGGNMKILHNTISMQGNYLSPGVAVMSACVGFRNSNSLIDFRDNILMNSSQPSSGSPASKSYCITISYNPSFTALNYNDYYSNGIGAQIGSWLGTDATTLAAWQLASGLDATSVSVDPLFTSSTNLVPTTTSMVKAGYYFATLPVDYAGLTRTSPPDIGAYEFSIITIVATAPATALTTTTATLNGTVNPNSYDANIYFDYGLTAGYGTTVNGTPFLVNGGVVQSINTPITGLAASTTYHFRIRALTFGGVSVFGNDLTFTTPAGIPATTTVTGTVTSVMDTCYNATSTITVAGTPDSFIVENGGSATFIAGVNIIYLPGTIIQSGGYMHGYITLTNEYCNALPRPAAPEKAGIAGTTFSTDRLFFSLYPNPTTGNFTLVRKGDNLSGIVNVEVYNFKGEKVMTDNMIGEKMHDYRFSDMATGLYFVKVIADGYVETMKLVKL